MIYKRYLLEEVRDIFESVSIALDTKYEAFFIKVSQ